MVVLSTYVPLTRCCAHHDDWQILAAHLVLDFAAVSGRNIVVELAEARTAAEEFGLSNDDALDCAELIVRNRVMLATIGTAPHQRGPNVN
jgi:hypothetical protein